MPRSRTEALQKVGAIDPGGPAVECDQLRAALRELSAPGELPLEYRRRSPGPVVLALLGATGAAAFLGLSGRLAPGGAIATVLVGVTLAIFASVVPRVRRARGVNATIADALREATPWTAEGALARIRSVTPDVLMSSRPDLLLRAVAELECWAGAPDRAAAVGHAALAGVDGGRAWRWIGGITAEVVRSLALGGRVEEARRWLTWGGRHLSPVFEGESWLARSLVLLREGKAGSAQELLEARLRDQRDLSVWARYEARALLAFAQGGSLPADVPPESVSFLGSRWPELARLVGHAR